MAWTNRPPKRYGALYLRKLDCDLRDAFKAYCARRGTTMTRAVEKFMKECARKEPKRTYEEGEA